MSFVPAFSASQLTGVSGSLTLSDDSSGTDAAISQRRVYFQLSDGSYLTLSSTSTDYETWAYASATKTFAILSTDYAISVLVQWLNVSNTVLYTKTILCLFDQFNKSFFYSLTQNQASSPTIVQDTTYYQNKAALWSEIIGAENAVEFGNDISGAQGCLDRASNFRNNENFYF